METIYEQLPLNNDAMEIRVLELHPSSVPTDPIRCSLRVVSLVSNPHFTALSYVWGDPNKTESIKVNGTIFHARVNLCSALRHRRGSDVQVYWVDALCINQKSNEEKTSQIRLMNQIYRKAQDVHIWLGEKTSYSERAMKFLKDAASIGGALHLLNVFDRTQAPNWNLLRQHLKENHHILEELLLFFQMEWWSRVWIIQEAALAQKAAFFCGSTHVSWGDFQSAFCFWTAMLNDPNSSREYEEVEAPTEPSDRRTISDPSWTLRTILNNTSARTILWQYFRINNQRSGHMQQLENVYGLQSMLEESWNFDSTDPKDKIYAWLGLQQEGDVTIEPDYNATDARVYAGLVKVMQEQIKSLTLVAFAGSACRESRPLILDLPSWAPDLRRDAMGRPAPYWLRPKSYTASAKALANGSISDDLRILTTDGIRVGRIQSVQRDPNDNVTEGFDAVCKLSRWICFALKNATELGRCAGSLHDMLFRTCISYWDDAHLPLQGGGPQAEMRNVKEMQIAFMALIGWLFRHDEYLSGRRGEPVAVSQEHHLYLLRTNEIQQPSGESLKVLEVGPAPEDLSNRALDQLLEVSTTTAAGSKRIVYRKADHMIKPKLEDYDNFQRFFEVFGIHARASPGTHDDYVTSFDDFQEEYGPWTRATEGVPPRIREDLEPRFAAWRDRFVTRFIHTTQTKSLFYTGNGYLGLGPKQTREGDFACIVRGCSLPVVIRELEDGGNAGNCFEVVSQCYVWGAMYGEAVQKMRERGDDWECLKFR